MLAAWPAVSRARSLHMLFTSGSHQRENLAAWKNSWEAHRGMGWHVHMFAGRHVGWKTLASLAVVMPVPFMVLVWRFKRKNLSFLPKNDKGFGGNNCIIHLELILKVTFYTTVHLKKDAVAPFILDSTPNPFRNRLSCLSQLTNHPHRCWASLPGKLHQGPHLETSLALGLWHLNFLDPMNGCEQFHPISS